MNYIEEYNQEIQSGKIIAGQWIKLFYEYLIKGLDNKLFYFSEEKANNVISWIEDHCYHTEGPLAPNKLKLELWQKAVLSVIYGIVDETGKRHFREIVLIMARKNGKSLFASSIAKYEWQKGGYGARVYCLAPKLDQTDIIYNSIWQQTLLDPEYQELKAEVQSGIKYHERKTVDDSELPKHRMTDLYIAATNSTVKKIAFSDKKSDGFNPSLTICDEIASWQGDKGLKMYEVMKSGMGAREMGENPSLLLSLSTSGYIDESIYEPERELDYQAIEQLSTCEWIDLRKNLLVTGRSSTGKTYIGNALGICAIKQFRSVRYIKASYLMAELEQAEVKGIMLEYMKKMSYASLLIIDDFGLMDLDANKCRNRYWTAAKAVDQQW